jgi:hypothetical protein
MLKKRIRSGFTRFFGWFGWFLAISEVKVRTNVYFFIGIDRARRARSGISLGIVMDANEANPFGFYWSFWVIWMVFGDFRGEDKE